MKSALQLGGLGRVEDVTGPRPRERALAAPRVKAKAPKEYSLVGNDRPKAASMELN